ncbi:MAG: TlyA family RNA methyltransferase [Clostridia bacterium]|nr:TlyA family RNA methyltransferase [Clostridia bacterium]MDE6472424.1 TlyA family RNA methyltransferase [Clostridia bacterium]
MRLDLYISSNQNITRTKAKHMIESSFVKVDGNVVTKAGYEVKDNSIVEILDSFRFSSLGGDKLQRAFDYFNYSVKNKVCVDIGASNGGFTDCMLKNGADKVFAVDVGECAFDDELKGDNRVIIKDRLNARYITVEDLGEQCDFASIDVSFISLKHVLPAVYSLIKVGGELIALIKPQFEAGPQELSKKGLVLSSKTHQRVCEDIKDFALSIGFEFKGLTTAPIKEGKNKEFLIFLYKSIE